MSPIRTCGRSQDWWVSDRSKQSHVGFLGSNGQLFPICPTHQGCACRLALFRKLVGPFLSPHDGGSKAQQRKVVSVRCHVKVRDGKVRNKVVKKGWEMTDPCPAPGEKVMGVFERGKSPSCLEGMPRAIQSCCIGVGSQPKTR